MKRPYAASSPAFPARAVKAALFGRAPHRPPKAAARPPGGPVRGPPGRVPYAPPLRGRAPPLPPSAPRPAQTTAALQEIRKGRAYTLASAFFLRSGSGNTAGNSAKRGTGQPGRFSLPRMSARRIARPPSPARVACLRASTHRQAGQGGRPRNASYPHRPHSGRMPRHRRGSSFGTEILGRENRPLR